MTMRRKQFNSNVINIAAIDAAVSVYGARVENETARGWWSRNFRNFLIRDPSVLSEITDIDGLADLYAKGALPLPVAKWAALDVNAGRPVHFFDPSQVETEKGKVTLAQIIDWMNALSPTDRHFQRLHKISPLEAAGLAEKWRAREDRRAAQDIPETANAVRTILPFDDGYRIVKLVSLDAFERESALLRNCLHRIQEFFSADIYSLRDAENQPHAAMEFRGGQLIQIRGFGNSIPRAKYRPYLVAFLRHMQVEDGEISLHLNTYDIDFEPPVDINQSTVDFINWAKDLPSLDMVPFLRDPKVDSLVDNFILYGADVRNSTKKAVRKLFVPKGRTWLNRCGTHRKLPGTVQIRHPRLPTTLYDLSRYSVLSETTTRKIFKKALSEIIDHAERDTHGVYDLQAGNEAIPRGDLSILLDEIGHRRRLEEAKARSREAKTEIIRASTATLARDLRRRDVSEARRRRTFETIQGIYPWLKGRLLSDEMVL